MAIWNHLLDVDREIIKRFIAFAWRLQVSTGYTPYHLQRFAGWIGFGFWGVFCLWIGQDFLAVFNLAILLFLELSIFPNRKKTYEKPETPESYQKWVDAFIRATFAPEVVMARLALLFFSILFMFGSLVMVLYEGWPGFAPILAAASLLVFAYTASVPKLPPKEWAGE